ncbi:MAG: hypothetical protein HN764_11375 [Gammaproteobacteria bacterium]|jgi:hypothetical protein|nr:hypothetical protein [Gammaproteobacteria bacterium]
MNIKFVKKIKADGTPCAKCADVEKRLVDNGQMESIDEIIIADERDPESLGMQLARRHQVDLAPFFLVLNDDNTTSIYTIYFQFVKEVLQGSALSPKEVA